MKKVKWNDYKMAVSEEIEIKKTSDLPVKLQKDLGKERGHIEKMIRYDGDSLEVILKKDDVISAYDMRIILKEAISLGTAPNKTSVYFPDAFKEEE